MTRAAGITTNDNSGLILSSTALEICKIRDSLKKDCEPNVVVRRIVASSQRLGDLDAGLTDAIGCLSRSGSLGFEVGLSPHSSPARSRSLALLIDTRPFCRCTTYSICNRHRQAVFQRSASQALTTHFHYNQCLDNQQWRMA